MAALETQVVKAASLISRNRAGIVLKAKVVEEDLRKVHSSKPRVVPSGNITTEILWMEYVHTNMVCCCRFSLNLIFGFFFSSLESTVDCSSIPNCNLCQLSWEKANISCQWCPDANIPVTQIGGGGICMSKLSIGTCPLKSTGKVECPNLLRNSPNKSAGVVNFVANFALLFSFFVIACMPL